MVHRPAWYASSRQAARGAQREPGLPGRTGEREAVVRPGAVDLERHAVEPPRARARPPPPELRELESQGIAIGKHSLTHPCLSRCDDEKIRREIEDWQRGEASVLMQALNWAMKPMDWVVTEAGVFVGGGDASTSGLDDPRSPHF